MLIDAGDVIVHVFRPEVREFYQLEKMWMSPAEAAASPGLMRLHICAVGRLRAGPERALIDDYLKRTDRTGRALGLGPVTVHEVEDRKGGGMAAEAELLSRAMPRARVLWCWTNAGATLTSPEFADLLARWRDDGAQDAAFVIGGADGLIRCAARPRRSQPVASGRWSGRTCWRASCWPNSSTAPRRSWLARPITGHETSFVAIYPRRRHKSSAPRFPERTTRSMTARHTLKRPCA